MLVHDRPYPPVECRGRLFVDRSQWMQVDPGIEPSNLNYPFGPQDRETPYHELRLVGIYCHPSRIDVWFDIDAVDSGSIEAVQDFLSSPFCRRPVRIEFYKDGWASERHPSGIAAVERISEIMAYRGVPLVTSTLLRERSVAELSAPGPGLLKLCFEAWKESPASDLSRSGPVADHVLAFASDNDGSLRYAHIGPKAVLARYFGEPWRKKAIGQKTQSILVDRDYNEIASRAIKSAAADGDVRYESVLVTLERPGRGREWAAYRRLHLPFHDHVIGVTQLEQSPDPAFGFLRPK